MRRIIVIPVVLYFLLLSASHVSSLTTIKVSRDLSSIGQFRYQIYVDEMSRTDVHKYKEETINHATKLIIDPMDSTATNFVAENETGEIIGCFRVNFGRDGNLGEYPEFYELESSPESLAHVCILSRFAVIPSYRSSFLPIQILKYVYKYFLEEERGIHRAYFLTNELTAEYYQRFGCSVLFEKEHQHYGRITALELDFYSPKSGPLAGIHKRVLTAQQVGFSMPATTPQRKWSRQRTLALGATTISTEDMDEVSDTEMESTIAQNDFRTQIADAFEVSLESFMKSKTICLLAEGSLTLSQYKSILREIYYYVREDPQIQVLMTVYLRGCNRRGVKALLQHAISEVNHEQLALNDLMALGEDVSQVATSRPLPTTMGLIAFAFYQIIFRNPIGHLGYLYFLEFLPTAVGNTFSDMLRSNGVPEGATSFLLEHTEADVGHNKLMEKHIIDLVQTQEDCNAVVHAVQTTAVLYAALLDGAIEQTDMSAHLPDGEELSRSPTVRSANA